MVVETHEMKVDHGVGSLVLHTKDHGFLCRLGETTMALVVMVLVVVVVLDQMVHWAQRVPLVVGLPFVQWSQTKAMVVDWLILVDGHLSLVEKDEVMLVECQKVS